jgi:Tfp pilus assembly protein PilO
MSAIFFESGGAASVPLSVTRLIKRLLVPLEAWSGRRRCVVALLIAGLVFGLGAYGWIVADVGGVAASRAALAASVQHLTQARGALAQLPVLRRAVAAHTLAGSTEPSPASWSSTDDVRLVSTLAAQNGVALLAVEPGAASGEGMDTMRPLQLTARTDFVHLMAFLHGFADLPVLIVPVDVTVKQDASALSVSATLHVFSALRPVPSADAAHAFDNASLDSDDDEDIVFFDPFAQPQMRAGGELPDVSQLRLVGVLHDRTRGLALLDTPDGVTTVESGQQIGGERVTRLDGSGIALASGAGMTRTLALAEAS